MVNAQTSKAQESKAHPVRTPMNGLANQKHLERFAKIRVRSTLIVEGISSPEVRFIKPGEFARLAVDPIYQRPRDTALVNTLIHVLRGGGRIYDPITVCKRPDGDKLYIVDGQQRFWAHYDTQTEIPALIYQSSGPSAEALLYQAMNARRNLSANNVVKSHQGLGADLLRQAAADESHPLFGQVDFGDQRRPYAAMPMLKAMLVVSRDGLPNGKAADVCARLDHALANDDMAEVRCLALLRMIPRVFPAQHPPRILALLGLAKVAYDRWEYKRTQDPISLIPSHKICERLRTTNWGVTVISASFAHLRMVTDQVERRWPEKSE